ncbi:TPA: hypothetical protein EYP38_00730 [Candidatus Micrarchaeota archaeon]|nr:hypothetical protein [Candidatus Micrarchaeota archaeon]
MLVWEPFVSAMAYDLFSPGQYAAEWGVAPGFSDHSMHGAGGPGIPCPFRDAFVRDVKLGRIPVPDASRPIRLMTDARQLEAYRKALQDNGVDGLLENASHIPAWEGVQAGLHELGFPAGRTSAGSVAAALEHASTVQNKVFLVIFYDSVEKY